MIDGHSHLDVRRGECDEALRNLKESAQSAGVTGIILLNIPEGGYDNKDVIARAKKYKGFYRVFPCLVPGEQSAAEKTEEFKNQGASGLKLHPRIHHYAVDSHDVISLVRKAGECGLPVLIDCFPDGKNLSLGNVPEKFAHLAEQAPDTRIAIGHAGGHRILDALMVAKYYKNIFLDLSYTLLYYRGSSVTKDIQYAISSIRAERIFWGTDFPDRPYGETVQLSRDELAGMNLTQTVLDAVLEKNVKNFLGEESVGYEQ